METGGISTARTINRNSPVALDSSVWLIEAALNTDFDKRREVAHITADTLYITAPISNNLVTIANLNTAYTNLGVAIKQLLGDTSSVEVIDVTAISNTSTIQYRVIATTFLTPTAQRLQTVNCNAFTTQVAAPIFFPYNVQPFFVCNANNPLLDGPKIIQDRLNCPVNRNCNQPGYGYFTNVTTVPFATKTNTQTQTLGYYTSQPAGTNLCTPAIYEINATKLNSFISLVPPYALSIKPTSPSGMSVISYTVSFDWTQGAPSVREYWWNYDVKYGVFICGQIPY